MLHVCNAAIYDMCMSETRWWKYLSSLMGNETATEAAKKSGISSSNFTRWKKGARADPDFVVKVARAYNADVLEALVAAEFITAKEAHMDSDHSESVTQAALDLERKARVFQRIQENTMKQLNETLSPEFFDQLKKLAAQAESSSNTVDSPVDELAQRRHVTPNPYSDTTPDEEDLPYVADSSPDEPMPGDDDYSDGP